MRVLVWYPGASVAVHELAHGLAWGLAAQGLQVSIYDASKYLPVAAEALRIMGERVDAHATWVEQCYHASLGIYDAALRRDVDWVVMVSGLYQPLDYVVGLQRAGIPVCAVLSESPYNLDREIRVAAVVDAAIVMERSAVKPMRTVVDQVAYLPHGWDPRVHHTDTSQDSPDIPWHEALCIGTGWPERVAWYSAVQAAGVDVALYGAWDSIAAGHSLASAVRGPEIENARVAAYYRRAMMVLNLHRQSMDYEGTARVWRAESVNPRVYEAFACGTYPLSDPRPEWLEIWPDLPTADSPQAMADLAVQLLREPGQRQDWIARGRERLHACRWDVRASRVAESLARWRPLRRRARRRVTEEATWHATTARMAGCI